VPKCNVLSDQLTPILAKPHNPDWGGYAITEYIFLDHQITKLVGQLLLHTLRACLAALMMYFVNHNTHLRTDTDNLCLDLSEMNRCAL